MSKVSNNPYPNSYNQGQRQNNANFGGRQEHRASICGFQQQQNSS